jgi:hypothetical protein
LSSHFTFSSFAFFFSFCSSSMSLPVQRSGFNRVV